MVFGAVFVANAYNGLNTNVWTGWVFFAIALGIVLLWLYTVVYDSIKPGWFVTTVYGNNRFLFQSPLFWLSLPIVLCVSILPMYLAKAWQMGFEPGDVDILRYVKKHKARFGIRSGVESDWERVGYVGEGGGLQALRRVGSAASTPGASSAQLGGASRPNIGSSSNARLASRTDMSTGVRSVHRGFDFVTEEGGVAMARMQSNLSSRRNLTLQQQGKERDGRHLFSIRRGILKKKSQRESGRPDSTA